MDYKGFKKISSDKNCTVLKHKHGHELKIAHSAISPKMKGELDKLPAVKMASGGQVKKYADGGDSTDTSYDTSTDVQPAQQAPVVVNVNSGPPQNQQQPQMAQQPNQSRAPSADQSIKPDDSSFSVTPVGQDQGQQQPQVQPQQQAPAPRSPQQPAQAIPQQNVPTPDQIGQQSPAAVPQPDQTYQNAYEAAQQAHKAEYAQEDSAFAQDLTNGHITPETYHSLFAKKDTLGKVSTLFGLMLAGAGSGLTGQPNSVLAGMNQEINNDLQAQMQSKANAQNFIKLNQAQQMQNASIEQMQKTGQLTEAQAKAMMAEANLKSFTYAQLQANRVAFHNQALMVSKMPEGPQKEQAKQALAMMGTAVNGENANIADMAAARQASMNMLGGQQISGQSNGAQNKSSGGVDFQRLNQLERMNQMKMPGAPSDSDLSEMTKEATKVNENRATRAVFMDSFDKLNNMALAGKLSPHERAAEVNTLSGQLAHQTVNRYNENEAKNQADGMFPAMGDWKSTREEKRRKAEQFFNAQESGTPTIDRFNLKTPLQNSMPSSGPSDGATGKYNGRPVIRKNRKWEYQ